MSTAPSSAPPSSSAFWLRGAFAPVFDELTVADLVVDGSLPPGLDATYLRNGPNPKDGVSPHWWFGDGMVHGIRLGGGRARWYRNRYVRTTRYTGQPPEPVDASAEVMRDRRVRGGGSSNTSVLSHGGRLLSLVEAALPMALRPDLTTIGPFDFAGALDRAMTAHPKVCPVTGELHFYSYQVVPPFVRYWIADRAGRVVSQRELEVDGPSLMHDFAITERHAVFFDSPARMVRDWGQGMPFAWSEDHPARIGVVPRAGGAPRWFEVLSGHLGHTVNAFEQGNTLVLEGVRYARFEASPPQLYRWELDLVQGGVREHALDERRWIEFPRIDERRVGRHHRYTYALELGDVVDGAPSSAHVRRYDRSGDASVVANLGPGRIAGEPFFVPQAPSDDAEENGWVLSLVYDGGSGQSELVVLDANHFENAPVARVRLPRRVPFGFHGTWLPASVTGD